MMDMQTSELEIETAIRTFFMATDNVPAGIPALFEQFEQRLHGLEGRHLYGITECIGDRLLYRACVLEKFAGEAAKFDLPYYDIPKGRYVCVVFKDWCENIPQISETFCELFKHPDVKAGSICLEDYASPDEMLLMVQHK